MHTVDIKSEFCKSEIITKMSSKRKRNSIPMQVKYDAILAVQLGNLTKTAIATKYDVSGREDYIKSAFESSTFIPSRKRMHTV